MEIYPFRPSQTAAFQFQPTLDGNVHTAIVTWNFWGQRYYLSVYDLDQVLVVSIAMVGSPAGAAVVDLVAGYFSTSKLIWRIADGVFEVTP